MNKQAIEALYSEYCKEPTIGPHLPTLRELASKCQTIVEFGVQYGRSTTAFLLGLADAEPIELLPGVPKQCKNLHSYDLELTKTAAALKALAEGPTLKDPVWLFHMENTRTAIVPACDLLFVDSFHSFEQVDAELNNAADKVAKYIVFHDTVTFGSVAAANDHGVISWVYDRKNNLMPESCLGIRFAIDKLMIRDPSWKIIRSDTHAHGLLVLERDASSWGQSISQYMGKNKEEPVDIKPAKKRPRQQR